MSVALFEQRVASRAISSTAYDTAWVASLPNPKREQEPRFPGALNWVTSHQLPDGSWGSFIAYEHDRIICTLAALIPMVRFGRRETDRVQIHRGERYLWQHAHLLRTVHSNLVGFELLLPTMMEMARDVGVNVPPYLNMYGEERARKLAKIPPELLYSSQVTTAHSFEFLGSQADAAQLLRPQFVNGSIGNSPAATAFVLHYVEDAAALAYLERCLEAGTDGGVPVLEPCETFETLWVAYNRFLGGVPAVEVLSPLERDDLQVRLATGGVGLSPSFPMPDADDTAVALLLLAEAGTGVSSEVLQIFERDDYFVTYPFENHSSTSANIHVLSTLTRFAAYPHRDRTIAKIVRYLRDARTSGGYWFDKWHISPFYATSHAIVALSEIGQEHAQEVTPLLATALEWLLQMQNEDGSWGFWGMPTTEETAYAVLALRSMVHADPRLESTISAGRAYLQVHHMTPRPPMWIGKCLYYPTRVVDSAIEAALH